MFSYNSSSSFLHYGAYCLTLFCNALQVLCSGVFELRLSSFTNERGLDEDGNCCNGVKDPTNPATGPMCTANCHTFFTICLTNYMNNIPSDIGKERCYFGYVMTDVLGENNVDFENLQGFNNVILFHFNVTWPVSITLSIILSYHIPILP